MPDARLARFLDDGVGGADLVDVPVAFGGVVFTPADHVFCDHDGVLASAVMDRG